MHQPKEPPSWQLANSLTPPSQTLIPGSSKGTDHTRVRICSKQRRSAGPQERADGSSAALAVDLQKTAGCWRVSHPMGSVRCGGGGGLSAPAIATESRFGASADATGRRNSSLAPPRFHRVQQPAAVSNGGVSPRRIQQITVSSGAQIHRRTWEIPWNSLRCFTPKRVSDL